jgi:hypothetical protein
MLTGPAGADGFGVPLAGGVLGRPVGEDVGDFVAVDAGGGVGETRGVEEDSPAGAMSLHPTSAANNTSNPNRLTLRR